MAVSEKTNVCRLLDAAGVSYTLRTYEPDPSKSGTEIASILGEDPDRVFKTLVTVGRTGTHYVFVIPVNEELNLKKAASVAGEKSIEMIRQKELLPLTGYVHGGCSPFGMKKLFKTYLHETAMLFDAIFVSAGKVGFQVEVPPDAILAAAKAEYADLV